MSFIPDMWSLKYPHNILGDVSAGSFKTGNGEIWAEDQGLGLISIRMEAEVQRVDKIDHPRVQSVY